MVRSADGLTTSTCSWIVFVVTCGLSTILIMLGVMLAAVLLNRYKEPIRRFWRRCHVGRQHRNRSNTANVSPQQDTGHQSGQRTSGPQCMVSLLSPDVTVHTTSATSGTVRMSTLAQGSDEC